MPIIEYTCPTHGTKHIRFRPETDEAFCAICLVKVSAFLERQRQKPATQPETRQGVFNVIQPDSTPTKTPWGSLGGRGKWQINGKARNNSGVHEIVKYEFPELSPTDPNRCDKTVVHMLLLADADPSDTRHGVLSSEEKAALTRLSR